LSRLAFIARAKQLGCSLEEIAGLAAAWDGGSCGPVQDLLRRLVAGKIAAAENQIAELATFTSELADAARALEGHRPEGECDSACGCMSLPKGADAPAIAPAAVSLISRPATSIEPDIACTLSVASMRGRLDDWRELLAHVARREPIEGGVRCVFGEPAPTHDLIRLVTAEQECCRFFQFAITVDSRGLALDVRAPDEGREIVESLFGAAT